MTTPLAVPIFLGELASMYDSSHVHILCTLSKVTILNNDTPCSDSYHNAICPGITAECTFISCHNTFTKLKRGVLPSYCRLSMHTEDYSSKNLQ